MTAFASTAMLNYGIKFHDLKENVVSRVGNFKNMDRKKEMLFWSEEEFKEFYAAIDDDLFKVYFSFLYLTGCRKGESLALTWNDIDFVRNEVRINKSLNRKQKEKGVKEQITIPLASSDLVCHIKRYKRQNDGRHRVARNEDCKSEKAGFSASICRRQIRYGCCG